MIIPSPCNACQWLPLEGKLSAVRLTDESALRVVFPLGIPVIRNPRPVMTAAGIVPANGFPSRGSCQPLG